MMASSKFRVALTGDFYDDQGQLKFRDIAPELLHSAPDYRTLSADSASR